MINDYDKFAAIATPEEVVEVLLEMNSKIERIEEENRIMRQNLADVNNIHRHTFDTAIASAAEELFGKMSFRTMTKEVSK